MREFPTLSQYIDRLYNFKQFLSELEDYQNRDDMEQAIKRQMDVITREIRIAKDQ